MPTFGVKFMDWEKVLTSREILRLAKIFKELGISKVRLTGGEPLLRWDLKEIVEGLKELNLSLNITTNGILLDNCLDFLKGRVDYLNISLDTFYPEKYAYITRSSPEMFFKVMKNIYDALEKGFKMVKINTVIVKGFNDDEIFNFVEFAKEKPVAIRFIEYMPFDGNDWSWEKVVKVGEIKEMISQKYQLIPINGYSEVSTDYIIPGFKGMVGFIGSMSAPFCNTCNRLRLTADGHLKPCLFSPFEVDLKTPLRSDASDEDIKDIIIKAVYEKPFGHPGAEKILKTAHKNRKMVAIGG